jgi:hypothetical protein
MASFRVYPGKWSENLGEDVKNIGKLSGRLVWIRTGTSEWESEALSIGETLSLNSVIAFLSN